MKVFLKFYPQDSVRDVFVPTDTYPTSPVSRVKTRVSTFDPFGTRSKRNKQFIPIIVVIRGVFQQSSYFI